MTPLPFSHEEAARVRLAADVMTPPLMLGRLADDDAVMVRAAVALNPVFSPDADRRLLADTDERVRILLAEKLARLLPGMTGAGQAAAQIHLHKTLRALAGDAAVRVRIAIAEALTTLHEAPRDVILTLAHDPVAAVSDPVVRLSPLLTDADLLDLLATPSHAGTAAVVAGRTALSAVVCDQIAAHSSSAAIRAMLENRSAALQEATLDALIGRAADHPDWHEPLVRRPSLPGRTARALAAILAGHLLDALASRTDLPDGLAATLRERVDQSLAGARPPSDAEVLGTVRRLAATGALTETVLMDAAAAGDHRMVAAILAVASGVALTGLYRAVALRSAKALTSLVWQAGFSMLAAQAVQSVLGQLGPAEVLPAGPHGAFPLSVDEMQWQIELLGEPAGLPATDALQT